LLSWVGGVLCGAKDKRSVEKLDVEALLKGIEGVSERPKRGKG